MHTAMPSVCSDVSIYYFLNIPAASYLSNVQSSVCEKVSCRVLK